VNGSPACGLVRLERQRRHLALLGAILALAIVFAGAFAAGTASAHRDHDADAPRTIVTSDPELDDLNSLIRFLLYSNEVRIEGLVYSSSQHHWSGDATRPPKRWKAGQSHIEDALDVYDQVYRNLRRHDDDYPTPGHLRSRYRVGNIVYQGDMAASTPGSKLIADVLLDDKPGPVFLQAWGGTNTIARALKDIEEKYAGTRKWPAVYAKVSKKAIITRFAAQDTTYADYIAPVWPKIENRNVATTTWGYFTRRALQPEDMELVSPEWTRANVSSVGPFGELYRAWGDGPADRRIRRRSGRGAHRAGVGRRGRRGPRPGGDSRRAAGRSSGS